jgi:hypothetical protein
MRLALSLSTALILFQGTAGPLCAQTVFVEGAAFVGIERLSHTSTQPPIVSPPDLSGTTFGGRVGVGTFLAPQWSVQAELTVPALLKSTTITQPIILTPLASPPVGLGQPAVVILPIPISITQTVKQDYRAPGVAVLVGYHTVRRGHVAVGYLGGLTFLEERQHTHSQVSYVGLGIAVPNQGTDTTTFTYRAAAAAGLDVDIALASHLGLVPQVRADVFLGGLSVRPAIALRWNF